nr:hypothetical protein BCU19_17570 [Vibrio cyclitrophicus]
MYQLLLSRSQYHCKRTIADQHFREDYTGKPWNEINETFRFYKASLFDEDSITNKYAHKLKLMDTFDTDIRPSLQGEYAWVRSLTSEKSKARKFPR